MAFVTYILLSTLIAGMKGAFRPELLGLTASNAFLTVFIEILLLKLGTYLLNISNDSQLLDLVAYSGYKFVGIISTVAISSITSGGKSTGGWVGWSVFTYTFMANAFFLVGLPEPDRFALSNRPLATLPQVRSPSRQHFGRTVLDADCRQVAAQPQDPILVPLRLFDPAGLYVVVDQVILNTHQGLASTGTMICQPRRHTKALL